MGLVVPRPIGWVGTVDAGGRNNLAPFSFFNAVASSPPVVIFAPGMASRIKDTLVNVRETGEFTLNVVTEEVAEAMNITAGDHPAEVDEFELAGLTPVIGDAVAAPMVAEAKANMECIVTDIVEVGGQPPASSVVFGEVLRIHVEEALVDGSRIDFEALRAVGRLAGGGYSRTRDLFWMDRPIVD